MKFPLIKDDDIYEVDSETILRITTNGHDIEFETFDGIYRPLTVLRDYRQYLNPMCEQVDKSEIVQVSKITSYDPLRRMIHFEQDGRTISSYVSRRQSRKIESFLHLGKLIY